MEDCNFYDEVGLKEDEGKCDLTSSGIAGSRDECIGDDCIFQKILKVIKKIDGTKKIKKRRK